MTDADLRHLDGVHTAARIGRDVLALASAMYVLLGIVLVARPEQAADALGLTDFGATSWVLQMLGVVLVGLGGHMWLARRLRDRSVVAAIVQAGALVIAQCVLTITMPGPWTPVRWAFLGMGVVFAATYAALLMLSRQRA